MKSATFPEMNLELAKDQEEYETLNVFTEYRDVQPTDEHGTVIEGPPVKVPWSMTACFELTDEEIAEIVKTRKIWHTQYLFGHNFHPISMSTQNPFTSANSNTAKEG